MVGGDRIDDELNKTSPAPTRRFIRCKTDRARSRWRGITCCVFIRIKPGLLLSRGTVRGLGGWPCPMWFPGLTFRVIVF